MAAPKGSLRGEYTFLPLERVIFGVGSLAQLPEEIARIGAIRALIVTGTTLASETDVIVSVAQALGSLHAGTFAGIRQHTPNSTVAQAIDAARALDADVLVSVGGGSLIDAAKAVAMELARERGVFPLQIALPTTLSAAEFSHSAGITDEQRRAKASFADAHVAPRIVILDAGLTLATPMQLWLSSGIRALDHAIETLVRTRHAPDQRCAGARSHPPPLRRAAAHHAAARRPGGAHRASDRRLDELLWPDQHAHGAEPQPRPSHRRHLRRPAWRHFLYHLAARDAPFCTQAYRSTGRSRARDAGG